MKKKIFGLCVVCLFFATTLGFSQNMVSSTTMRCTRLVINGQDFTSNVSSAYLGIWSDSTSIITLNYTNGNKASFHFSDGKYNSRGQIESKVSLQSGGQWVHNLTSLSSESPGLLVFFVYESDGTRFAEISLRAM